MSATIQNCYVKFAYECPKQWLSLKTTDRSDVRFCETCSKEVYFCKTGDEASDHAKLGHCVAIQAEEMPEQRMESIHSKLKRIRPPRVGIYYEVHDATTTRYDEAARQALDELGRIIEQETRNIESEQQTDDSNGA